MNEVNEVNTSDILVISGVSHLLYSLIQSSLILSLCDPLELGLVSVTKRIVIIVAIYLYHQQQWTLVNVFSSFLCLLITFTGSVMVIIGGHKDPVDNQNYYVKTKKSSKFRYSLNSNSDYYVV